MITTAWLRSRWLLSRSAIRLVKNFVKSSSSRQRALSSLNHNNQRSSHLPMKLEIVIITITVQEGKSFERLVSCIIMKINKIRMKKKSMEYGTKFNWPSLNNLSRKLSKHSNTNRTRGMLESWVVSLERLLSTSLLIKFKRRKTAIWQFLKMMIMAKPVKKSNL